MNEKVYVGDKVVITEGPFKGMEGYVSQIEADLQVISPGSSEDIVYAQRALVHVIVDRHNTIFVSDKHVKKVGRELNESKFSKSNIRPD